MEVCHKSIVPRERIAVRGQGVERRGDVVDAVVTHDAYAIVVEARDAHQELSRLLRTPEIIELSSRYWRARCGSAAIAISSSMRPRCTAGSRSSSRRLLRIDIACTWSMVAVLRWCT